MSAAESEIAALREELEDLRAENDDLHKELDTVKSENETLSERIGLLLEEKAQDRQRIAELEDYRAENEHDKATIRKQVTEVEQTAPTVDVESAESSAESGPTGTPMEQLIQAGEAGVIGHVTASIERAETMARHFSQWASKAPNGLVIKENLKTLLETATGERLAWNQVYRAAEALEEFTGNAVEFTKHRRFGWILVAEPAMVRKLSRASSVGER